MDFGRTCPCGLGLELGCLLLACGFFLAKWTEARTVSSACFLGFFLCILTSSKDTDGLNRTYRSPMR